MIRGVYPIEWPSQDEPFQQIPQVSVTSLNRFGGGQPSVWWRPAITKDSFWNPLDAYRQGSARSAHRLGVPNTANYSPLSFNDILYFADDEALQTPEVIRTERP